MYMSSYSLLRNSLVCSGSYVRGLYLYTTTDIKQLGNIPIPASHGLKSFLTGSSELMSNFRALFWTGRRGKQRSLMQPKSFCQSALNSTHCQPQK